MLSDIEIAQKAKLKFIEEIAEKAGILPEELEPHGKYKAKVSLKVLKRLTSQPDGKLILVTTMTPTPAGEGKTTTTVGLGQALAGLGKKTFITLREPSLGPCLGVKGGAAGGGYSQVLPMEDINLHFIGDIHVIGSAHNLLAALIDNHLYRGNALKIDPRHIRWRRVMDMNDRALRKIMVGLDSGQENLEHESGFDITASSEVMAIMCLAESLTEMKERLGRIMIGFNLSGRSVHAADLKAQGAMALLMKDVLKPNLVQAIEGVPAFVHGGPFANIAHGCNSLTATKIALKLADYVVTEAGFGVDLGAEKFFDIKCRKGNLKPAATVMVVTIRALKRQGGVTKEGWGKENVEAIVRGLDNLAKHIESLQLFNVPIVIAINRMPTDTPKELDSLLNYCRELGVKAVVSEVCEKGGKGGRELAEEVIKLAQEPVKFRYLYDFKEPMVKKIDIIARKIYGVEGVKYTPEALRDIQELEKLGLAQLPICVAKTQYSLSDDPELLGRPQAHKISVRCLRASSGAGFIVAYMGNIVTMPGLPKHPAAENMDVSAEGKISGLF